MRKSVFLSFIISVLIFCFTLIAKAQYWQALPPYNTLWPLWSPVLSPIDPLTGLPNPIVNDLASVNVLPVQPVLTWDPSLTEPWFLYNAFGGSGLLFFNGFFGMNPWPPPNLVTTTGLPNPIILPLDYAFLPPTNPIWLQTNISIANLTYLSYLEQVAPYGFGGITIIPSFSTLLTANEILGL